MKLAIAGDSAGEPLAIALNDYLKDRPGLAVSELSHLPEKKTEFYADMAARVSKSVASGDFDRAILICGTGIGVSISANKVPGIRAALVHDVYSAGKASTSNNAQIITMGARVIGVELAKMIVDTWLDKAFDFKGPSAGNVEAINQLDQKYHAKS